MFPIEISSSLGGEAGTLAWKNSKSFYKLRAAAGLARHDGLMHAAKSMKNGSEWDGPFDLFNRYISRENMKEYDGPNRCYSSTTAVVPEAHVIVLCKNIFFSRYF